MSEFSGYCKKCGWKTDIVAHKPCENCGTKMLITAMDGEYE